MSLVRSALTVGGYTTISRILGFIRDQLVAFTLGTGFVAEAFFVAQRIPNMFRALFAEGAFNSAFVPLFAKKLEGEGPIAAQKFGHEVFSVLLAWVLVFCIAAMIFMPWLIYLIAPGFSATPERVQLTVDLLRLCFPYLLFMSLTALQGGVLNSLNRFTAAAAAPILLNIVMIASNIVAWYFQTGNTPTTGYIFATGVSLAGVAQFLLLAIACRKAGMAFLPSWPKLTPDVKQVLKLSVPGIISGGIMQINLLIATMIATSIDHAVGYLYYADRLYQLPLGIIIVAIGVVLLPTLSRKLRAGDTQGAMDAKNRALELSLFLTLPSAAALMVIAVPIIHTVFEHGAFHAGDTQGVAMAVMAFAAGLPAYALTKVFQPGFYAREDTSTPMRFAIISVVVNITASLILSRYWGHVGIAIATSLAAWTNALLLYHKLNQLEHFDFDTRSRLRLPLIIVSTFVMAAILWAASWLLQNQFGSEAHFLSSLWALGLLVTAGIGSYFGTAQLTGAFRISDLKAALKR
jgi:putative peptidoglycan lipid II flippase